MSNPAGLLKRAGKLLSRTLLPHICYVCAAPNQEDPVCKACAAELPRLTGPCCPICALPTVEGSVCGACLKRPPQFDETRVPFSYAFPVDRMVQALKYRHQLHFAPFFGEALASMATGSIDLLIPMPLHRDRLRDRGFNQAVEIARSVSYEARVPMSLEAVMREQNAPPQASLPWKERRRNVRGAFRCVVDLAGKHVVVIDDVMTTGATLGELARSLKARGAARVTNLVAARTPPP